MPSNIEIVNQKAREYIHNRLMVIKDLPEGQSIASITRDTVLIFPVNENFVTKFITRCYINDKIITLREGILYWNKQ
jgi:hypothetical protein